MNSAQIMASAYGMTFRIDLSDLPSDRDWTTELVRALPPGASPVSDVVPDFSVRVHSLDDGYVVDHESASDGTEPPSYATVGDLCHGLERVIGARIAHDAPGAVFIHAGVVDTPEGALLFPGRSFAGKTTLVSELLAQGCRYLSDEYAVLGADGLVRAYPRHLSHRVGTERRDEMPPDDVPVQARPVRAVFDLRYSAGATLNLQPRTPGQVVLHLVDNAVAARARSSEVLSVSAAVARNCQGRGGVRGESADAARGILQMLAAEA